jgi:hypothetical protein
MCWDKIGLHTDCAGHTRKNSPQWMAEAMVPNAAVYGTEADYALRETEHRSQMCRLVAGYVFHLQAAWACSHQREAAVCILLRRCFLFRCHSLCEGLPHLRRPQRGAHFPRPCRARSVSERGGHRVPPRGRSGEPLRTWTFLNSCCFADRSASTQGKGV